MTLPLVVVESGAAAVADAAHELSALGWAVGSEPGPASVLVLRLTGEEDAHRGVLAAVAGTGLLVDAFGAERDLVDRLCDDLRRLGMLDHRVDPGRAVLDADQHRLLALLCGGASLGAAAAAVHLSRRSADRRLAEARRALGADSTAAALASYRRRLERLPGPA